MVTNVDVESTVLHPRIPLYLASRSGRRAELLAQVGIPFTTIDANVDESRKGAETPLDFVERLAREKATVGFGNTPGDGPRVALGADTIVVVRGEVFGKPAGRREAHKQLQMLARSSHVVLTAVAVAAGNIGPGETPLVGELRARTSRSRVWFGTLTPELIDAYWDTGEPTDKAGSYAIQGLAARYIARLEGSYSGVMGLPLYETCELLRGVAVLQGDF